MGEKPIQMVLANIDGGVWGTVHASGTLAARPAPIPANNGYFYFATDLVGGTLQRSNGAAWQNTGGGAGAVDDDGAYAPLGGINAWTQLNTFGAGLAVSAGGATITGTFEALNQSVFDGTMFIGGQCRLNSAAFMSDDVNNAEKISFFGKLAADAQHRFGLTQFGKMTWGDGAGGSVSKIEQTAPAVLALTGVVRGSVSPANIADLTRKDYVDAGDDPTVAHNPTRSQESLKQANRIHAATFDAMAVPLGANVLTDGVMWLVHANLPLASVLVSACSFESAVAGNFVGDNTNNIGLYELVGTTLTLVASGASDPNLWKHAGDTIVTKAMAVAYQTVAARRYYWGLLWNTSDAVPAAVPQIYCTQGDGSAAMSNFNCAANEFRIGQKATATLAASFDVNTCTASAFGLPWLTTI